jgi:predicted Zn-dependent protease
VYSLMIEETSVSRSVFRAVLEAEAHILRKRFCLQEVQSVKQAAEALAAQQQPSPRMHHRILVVDDSSPVARKALSILAAILCGPLLTACAANPVTGKNELALISEPQEMQMGQQAAEQTRQGIGLVKDDALQAYVQGVGAKLAADSERPQLSWSFQVVDDPTPNAFTLPGGFIFVTRGLMGYMNSEAELAAVLGHEIGFRYALQDKYDVREMDDVFESLQSLSGQNKQSALPTWAATHPDEGERIRTVRSRIAKLPPGSLDGTRIGEAEFLNRIEGLTFGDNPRQGYFKQNRFVHPDMAFQFSFPAGWKMQNLPQAVVGVSPQQDAVIQLTLVGDEPAQAAQRFLGQQGLQAGEVARRTVNGLSAVVAQFGAQTQQGVVQGLVGFVRHGNATYQLVGYSPTQRYASMERTFLGAIDSFGRLEDRDALNAQPRRIDIVKLPRAMTLQEFSRAYPSTVDIKTLALINQVSSATASLPVGKRVKRVVER